MLDIGEIVFEEWHYNAKLDELVLYFIAPPSILGNRYPEAESAEICIVLPGMCLNLDSAQVSLSPTKDGLDYDWFDFYISNEDFCALLNLANIGNKVKPFMKKGE